MAIRQSALESFCGILIVVHHSLDSILESDNVKIDEQANTQVQEAEVGKELCLVHGMKRFFTFNLDHHLIFDHQVGSKSAV